MPDAEVVATIARELEIMSQIAMQNEFPVLAYLLCMARMEAESLAELSIDFQI
jgi:hypothetical protein